MIAESANYNPDTIFKEFCCQHDLVNRFFRSTESCYRLTTMQIEALDKAELVRFLFPARRRRSDTLKQYKGRFEASERRSQATIEDLRKDVGEDWDLMHEAVIVKEVSAFEQFVRGWVLAAALMEIESENSHLSDERRNSLNALVNDLTTNMRLGISLHKLSEYFPAVVKVLASSTHKRAFHPLLSAPTLGISCLDAAQMWREVRNLILHHGRMVHDDFSRKWSQIWVDIAREAQQSGHLIAIRPAVPGHRLPLVTRHAVFCLTTCYQAAVVFYIAAGGTKS